MQSKSKNQKSKRKCKLFLFLLIIICVVIVDFFSKRFVLQNLQFNEPIVFIENFWQWRLVFNPGAAFSLLADAGGWQKYFFMATTLLISGYLFYLLLQELHKTWQSVGFSLILGGAIANLIDRFLYGAVVDFIDWHYYDKFYYPTFNFADSAVCLGVFLVMINIIFFDKNKE